MLQTKEELKRAIRDYLVNLPSKTKHFEDYTLSKISEAVNEESSTVDEAITELRDEGVLESRKVHLDIHLPNTDEGFEVLTTYAKKGFVSYSPYWAVFFGFALFFIGISLGEKYLTVPTGTGTLFDAYRVGIDHGIAGTFVIGLIGGYFIQKSLGKFRRWQIVSEETYETISTIIKHTIYIFVPLVGAYYVIANHFGYPLELGVVFGLIGAAAASAFSYDQLINSKRVVEKS